MLQSDSGAVLVDVRTTAEWTYVGVPDLSSINKQARLVEWISFPSGDRNQEFLEQATDGVDAYQHILLLCRSGVRSQAAAEALRAAGWTNAHNVAAGFEGDVGPDRHRHGGWNEHLPWVQN